VPGENGENADEEIRALLQRYPGVYLAIHPFLVERMEEVMSGVVAQVVVKIFGDDLGVLDRKAREVAQLGRRAGGIAAGHAADEHPAAPGIDCALRLPAR